MKDVAMHVVCPWWNNVRLSQDRGASTGSMVMYKKVREREGGSEIEVFEKTTRQTCEIHLCCFVRPAGTTLTLTGRVHLQVPA